MRTGLLSSTYATLQSRNDWCVGSCVSLCLSRFSSLSDSHKSYVFPQVISSRIGLSHVSRRLRMGDTPHAVTEASISSVTCLLRLSFKAQLSMIHNQRHHECSWTDYVRHRQVKSIRSEIVVTYFPRLVSTNSNVLLMSTTSNSTVDDVPPRRVWGLSLWVMCLLLLVFPFPHLFLLSLHSFLYYSSLSSDQRIRYPSRPCHMQREHDKGSGCGADFFSTQFAKT